MQNWLWTRLPSLLLAIAFVCTVLMALTGVRLILGVVSLHEALRTILYLLIISWAFSRLSLWLMEQRDRLEEQQAKEPSDED